MCEHSGSRADTVGQIRTAVREGARTVVEGTPAGVGPLMELGRRLEASRRRRGWTFRELESRTELPRSTLHYLFRGRKRAPDYFLLTALVATLGEAWDDDWENLWRAAVDAERTPADPPAVGPSAGAPRAGPPAAGPGSAAPRQLAAGPGGVPPRQLPAAPGLFSARQDALDRLDLLLEDGPATRSTAVVVGPGGIGKPKAEN